MPLSRRRIAVGEGVSDLDQLPAGVQKLIDSVDEILVMAPVA
ncbi:MAG: hypothetical protein ACRDMH_16270 [Solirubrobacterales bacterium]